MVPFVPVGLSHSGTMDVDGLTVRPPRRATRARVRSSPYIPPEGALLVAVWPFALLPPHTPAPRAAAEEGRKEGRVFERRDRPPPTVSTNQPRTINISLRLMECPLYFDPRITLGLSTRIDMTDEQMKEVFTPSCRVGWRACGNASELGMRVPA
jgi:hypothetical protein